jgi:chromosome segregation ATPase
MNTMILVATLAAIPALTVGGALVVAGILRKEVKEKMNALLQQLQEVNASVAVARQQIEKARVEVISKIEALNTRISELEEALANGNVTPEVQAALDAVKASLTELKAASQAIDDVVPDAPAPQG